MRREDLEYSSRDGSSRIHGVKWIPDQAPLAILIVIHGMAEHLERYSDFAQYMCDRGFVVAINDHLGHGKSMNDNPPGFFCSRDPATVLVRDVHRLKKLIQSEYPGIPVFLFGHSMGSLICRNYIARYGKGIDGAVICGTLMMPRGVLLAMGVVLWLFTLFMGERAENRFLNNMAFGSYLKRIDHPESKSDWLSRDREVVRRFEEDPLCGFAFTNNGFRGLRDLCLRLYDKKELAGIPADLPLLLIYGREDPCGEYGRAVERVYHQYVSLGIKDVTIKGYEDDRHELLNELNREQVMEDVSVWIAERKKQDVI